MHHVRILNVNETGCESSCMFHQSRKLGLNKLYILEFLWLPFEVATIHYVRWLYGHFLCKSVPKSDLTWQIEQIQLHDTRRRKPSYSAEQLKHIESLNETTSFLQGFLENYSNRKEVEYLENLIRDVVDEALDIIESHIVNYIISPRVRQNISSEQSFEGLQKIIEDMNSIKELVMVIKDRLQPQDLVHPGSLGPPASENDIPTVEVDDRFNQIMDKLSTEQSDLQVIPITGMGGIGKTTLAKKIYDHDPYRRSFDVCAWVTISQVYNIQEVLSNLVQVITNRTDHQESSDYHELGKKLYQHLLGRRYLIVIDDMWDACVWDKLKLFIPNNNNGSRILVTTRLLKVANYINSSRLYEMDLLDENESWSLLCRKAFGQEGCPYPELEEIAKEIAKKCKGLPLSIVVIAGLLAKSKLTREFLEGIVNETIQTINSEDNGNSLRILLLSYNHLPIHLKPCLLHMGAYPEDHKIRVSTLIRLWVAEGFLKPNNLKILEEVAEDYLKDLVERNLIMVDEWGSTGRMKTCIIHDLVRDLCLKESNKSKFLCVTKMLYPCISCQIYGQRRIAIHRVKWTNSWLDSQEINVFESLESTLHARSLTMHDPGKSLFSNKMKLLRVFSMFHEDESFKYAYDYTKHFFPEYLYNLRYIDTFYNSTIGLLSKKRNLQTVRILIANLEDKVEKLNIWKMLDLRHLKIDGCYGIHLTDPPLCGLEEESVLENLQTLSRIVNFKCTEEVIKRIPNVKKLGLIYSHRCETSLVCSLASLRRLHKLQALEIHLAKRDIARNLLQNIVFPPTLKRLNLFGCGDFDDIIINIGQLPNLEKLTLRSYFTLKWDSVEGQFICLKYLDIGLYPRGMVWAAESSHFPALESLVIRHMSLEIPFGLADSTTLRSIHLKDCEESTIESAKNILAEQMSFDIEGLRIMVTGKTGITTVYQ